MADELSEVFNLTNMSFEYELRGTTFLEEVDIERTSKYILQNPGKDKVFIRTREKFDASEPQYTECTLGEWLMRISSAVSAHLYNHDALGTYEGATAETQPPKPEWIIYQRR